MKGKKRSTQGARAASRAACHALATMAALGVVSTASAQKTYVLKSGAQETSACLSSLRPVDTQGAPAPFVITSQVFVDMLGPYDPNAPANNGTLNLYWDSTGVRTQSCDAYTGRVSGNAASSDEQMTFTFDSPVFAQGISVELAYVNFALEEPVVFLSSTASQGYDFVITKGELHSAYVPSGLYSGFVHLRLLTSLPAGTQIDRLAFRETNADYGIQQLVLANPAANLDQVRNGSVGSPNDPGQWVNGNAGQSNSHYIEGFSIPYRVVMTDVPVGPVISVVLAYDAKHSDKHAIDFLTHYDRIEPHNIVFGHTAEEIDPTENPSVAGVTVNSAPTDTEVIPAPTSINSPTVGEPTNAYNDLLSFEGAANLSMSLWNANFATPTTACCEDCPTPLSLLDLAPIYYSGADPVEAADPEEVQVDLSNTNQGEQQITVSFIATSPTVILSWGGHIGTSDTWGAGNSAGGISGSPYHMRLLCWCPDNLVGNLGNQDRSLSADAIVVFEACCLPDGTCDDQLSASECEDADGTPFGPGSVCGTPEACCFGNGSCSDQDPQCCELNGGTPLGPGTSCNSPAPSTVGAGDKARTRESQERRGDEVTRAAAGVPAEACCCANGNCTMVHPLCCEEQGCTPGGPGSDCSGPLPCCGNGITEGSEECDDGNANDTDSCRNDCTIPVCGDGIVDAQNGETCDPPGSPAGGNGNNCRLGCTVCGDGLVQMGEQCDDGNGVNNDACRNDCTAPVCGDGIVDGQNGETCDPPGSPAGGNGNNCTGTCTSCGDGIVQMGEQCDDGNGVNNDACRNNCTARTCGDGIVDPQNNETCDPPGSPAGSNGNNCTGTCTSCGDGIVQVGEQCDDGNGVNNDACRNNCTTPVCGDGIVDAQNSETCDPPGSPAGGNGNNCTAFCTSCGDGVVDAGEQCDDGNGVNNDACRNNCTAPFCGDGVVDPQNGETCDPAGSPAGGNGNSCRSDCTVCGDLILDPGEQCDDGNGNNTDGCRNDCTTIFCGDGIVDANQNETCDPPGSPAGGNGNNCGANCTVCGDGVVDGARGEQCDDGNGVNNDACRNNCTAPVCGDGIVDAQNGETCDPPGSPAGGNGNNCTAFCMSCGDGVVDPGEQCDDGNGVNNDACRNNCTAPVCGDGIVDAQNGETCDPPGSPAGGNGNNCTAFCMSCGDGVVDPGEQCDDGNGVNNDACRNNCTAPVCGDGIVDAQNGETCDPPGSPAGGNGNNCTGTCTSCGDSVVDAGEQCDDGNGNNADGCRNDCTIPVCGDGIVDPQNSETCDPPGSPAGGNGNNCTGTCTSCGDGFLQMGEQCDDGNGIDTDACRNNCTSRVCGDGIVDAQNGETCDPPGSPAGGNGNNCTGTCTSCGDGVVQMGEQCDDGNGVNTDGCRNNCTIRVCGDGIVDPQNGETCDPPGSLAGGNGNNCEFDCTSCGDAVVQPGEQCDDGNGINNDGCRNDCTNRICGDGTIDPQNGETCDPPGSPAGGNGNNCEFDCTSCGDAVVQPGEDCDDGNGLDDCACRNDCTIPVCGDGLIDPACEESCDPPGSPAGGNGNSCRMDCTVCGDLVLDPGEQCDDGNGIDDDGCRNNCTSLSCGDGVVDPQLNETCDPPGSPAGGNGNLCGGACTVCGDGIVNDPPIEECDDGNGIDDDGCRNDCTIPVCGDGIVDGQNGETCDPPGSLAGGNGNNCTVTCTSCGDGVVQPGEECDDGNGIDDDDCRNDCTIPVCGDGILDDGETCDPPGSPAGGNGNNCDSDCTVCGDSIVDADEECDDGNAIDDDDCRNDCTIPVCGDGIVDGQDGETCDPPGSPAGGNGNICGIDCTVCGDGVVDAGEECDDGNGADNDDCRNDCTVRMCGDGIVDAGNGETCDPPGSPAGGNGNNCRPNCTACGDGATQAGEQCDDGNGNNADGCRNNCTIPACGDGIVDAGETCDPPGSPAGGNGNMCRANCTVCGDGVDQAGELCDDGNGVEDDGCNNGCTLPEEQVEEPVPAVGAAGMAALLLMLLGGVVLTSRRRRGPVHGS